MKKLVYIGLMLLFTGQAAQAQTEKGSLLLGGTGYFNSSKQQGFDRISVLFLNPRVGYFISNNISIGTTTPVELVRFNKNINYKSLGAMPFVRSYIGASSTRMFVEGKAGIHRAAVKGLSDGFDRPVDWNLTYRSYGLGAGVVHFINKHAGLELMLNYERTSDQLIFPAVHGFTGFSLQAGFLFYLPTRKEATL
jgi:hypothetical protein